MSLVVYGIKSCDSCRKARKFLQDRHLEHQFHDLREDGLNIQMLERWADQVGWDKLVNRRSLSWRKIPEVDRNDMNRDKAMAALIDQPTLLKRPVLETEGFFAIGFSEKRFSDFLDGKA